MKVEKERSEKRRARKKKHHLSLSSTSLLPIQRLLRDHVIHARQVRQLGQRGQSVEIGQIPQRVISENQRREVRDDALEVGADPRDPVVGEQERA